MPATSTQVKCVINLQETGAIAKAGYLADPSTLPTAGQVFYGRAVFGATTDTACGSGDQLAELDLVLPPGGRSRSTPRIRSPASTQTTAGRKTSYPTCPTQAIAGAYGPAIPSDDAGHAWTMPAGREFDVRFPLRSDRKLTGPAGGHCPQSVDEIPAYPQRDCLLIALHVADGYADPWLTPSEELFIDPAIAPVTPVVSHIAFPNAHLAKAGKQGLRLSMHCATGLPRKRQGGGRRGDRQAPASRNRSAHADPPAGFRQTAGKTATVHLKLSRKLAGEGPQAEVARRDRHGDAIRRRQDGGSHHAAPLRARVVAPRHRPP